MKFLNIIVFCYLLLCFVIIDMTFFIIVFSIYYCVTSFFIIVFSIYYCVFFKPFMCLDLMPCHLTSTNSLHQDELEKIYDSSHTFHFIADPFSSPLKVLFLLLLFFLFYHFDLM